MKRDNTVPGKEEVNQYKTELEKQRDQESKLRKQYDELRLLQKRSTKFYEKKVISLKEEIEQLTIQLAEKNQQTRYEKLRQSLPI